MFPPIHFPSYLRVGSSPLIHIRYPPSLLRRPSPQRDQRCPKMKLNKLLTVKDITNLFLLNSPLTKIIPNYSALQERSRGGEIIRTEHIPQWSFTFVRKTKVPPQLHLYHGTSTLKLVITCSLTLEYKPKVITNYCNPQMC